MLLAWKTGGLRSPAIRWALGALVVGILVSRSPDDGFSLAELDRVKLVLAAAATILVACRDRLPREARGFALGLVAAVSLLAHVNFLAFHGRGVFVHGHDLAHYYLGSKYAPEIGYGELYAAVARAEVEIHGRLPVDHARDLATGGVIPSERLLEPGDAVRRRFVEQRWHAFLADVEAVHARIGPRIAEFLNDHGYNPTPVWSLVGGTIANLVPAGSGAGITALSAIDPLLLAVAFAAVAWSFGVETALLAVAYYGLLYGATFHWVGGAFLRHLWFAGVLIGASLAHRGWAIAAGCCLALATTLRVFPVFLLVAPAAGAARRIFRRDARGRDDLRLVLAFGAAGVVLALATFALAGGIERWLEFRHNIDAHTASLTSNFVGLPAWLRYAVLGIGIGGEATVEQLFETPGAAYPILVGGLLVAAVLFAATVGPRSDDMVTRLALGIVPIVFGLRLAHYYYVVLVILVLAHRARADRLAMLFAAETAMYVLALFEIHFSVMCLFRGLVTAYLLVALWFDDLRDVLRPAAAARAPVARAS